MKNEKRYKICHSSSKLDHTVDEKQLIMSSCISTLLRKSVQKPQYKLLRMDDIVTKFNNTAQKKSE